MTRLALFPEVAELRHAEHEIESQFLNRWSPRSFQDKPVPETLLRRVLEAARWAPSGNNLQPWRFIVAATPDRLRAFHTFINPGNLTWCAKAPVLILVLSKTTTDKGTPARTHAFDAGAAWGYLALEAIHLGLVSHAMGGFDQEAARTTLQIPEDYAMHAVVALGYRGPADALPPERQAAERPSTRRPIEDSIVDFTV